MQILSKNFYLSSLKVTAVRRAVSNTLALFPSVAQSCFSQTSQACTLNHFGHTIFHRLGLEVNIISVTKQQTDLEDENI